MKKVNFGRNQISRIAPKTFTGLPTIIQRLVLNHNQLSEIGSFSLRGLQNTKELFLYNNQISVIEHGAFIDLSAAQNVFLNHNCLTHLKAGIFNYLSSCENLYLSDNQISKIDVDSFTRMVHLEKLHVENNKLSNLLPGLFNKLLKELYLFGNQLSTISSGLFTDVSRPLILLLSTAKFGHDNVWNCDTLCWLKEEEMAGNVTFTQGPISYKPKCSSGRWNQLSCAKGLSVCSLQANKILAIMFVWMHSRMMHSLQMQGYGFCCEGSFFQFFRCSCQFGKINLFVSPLLVTKTLSQILFFCCLFLAYSSSIYLQKCGVMMLSHIFMV